MGPVGDIREELLRWSPSDFVAGGFDEVVRRLGVVSRCLDQRELSDLFLLVLAEDLDEARRFPEVALVIGRELLSRNQRDRRLLSLLVRLLSRTDLSDERRTLEAQLNAIPATDSELAIAAIAKLNATKAWANLTRAEQLRFFERVKSG